MIQTTHYGPGLIATDIAPLGDVSDRPVVGPFEIPIALSYLTESIEDADDPWPLRGRFGIIAKWQIRIVNRLKSCIGRFITQLGILLERTYSKYSRNNS